MNYKTPKVRYVIEFNGTEFVMTDPKGVVTSGLVPWKLSKQAFDNDADEVVHNYDLGIVDSLGRLT